MPAGVTYDADSETLILGDGRFTGVTPAVRAYAVGGRNVIDSWVNYRKAEPGGKKTSPLDLVHEETWPADWSRELIDLLTVLRRLTDLEPQQDALLTEILAGTTLTMDELAAAGTAWPLTKKHRAVHRSLFKGPGCFDLDGTTS